MNCQECAKWVHVDFEKVCPRAAQANAKLQAQWDREKKKALKRGKTDTDRIGFTGRVTLGSLNAPVCDQFVQREP